MKIKGWVGCLALAVLALSAGSMVAQVTTNGYTFTTLDYPGAIYTVPYGLNDNGDIVGAYSFSLSTFQGFLYTNGIFATIMYPGATNTFVTGINDFGDIVGYYTTLEATHGFLYSGGTFTAIDFPGTLGTYLRGINYNVVIVGAYTYLYGYTQGFVYNNGTFVKIIYPGALVTYPYALNDSSQTVGTYVVAGSPSYPFGFLHDREGFRSITSPNLGIYATSINNMSEIAGYSWGTFTGRFTGYILSKGLLNSIQYPGAYGTLPYGINDKAQVVGQYCKRSNDCFGGPWHGFIATPQWALP